jgi:hypothetical protein
MNHSGPEQFDNEILPPMNAEEVKSWVYDTPSSDDPMVALRLEEDDQRRKFMRIMLGVSTKDELANDHLTVEEADHALDEMGRTFGLLSPPHESKSKANLNDYTVSHKLRGAK